MRIAYAFVCCLILFCIFYCLFFSTYVNATILWWIKMYVNTTAVRIKSWIGCCGENDDRDWADVHGVRCWVLCGRLVQSMRASDWSLITSSEQESGHDSGDWWYSYAVRCRPWSYIDRCSVADWAHASYCILRHKETVSWGWRIVSEL